MSDQLQRAMALAGTGTTLKQAAASVGWSLGKLQRAMRAAGVKWPRLWGGDGGGPRYDEAEARQFVAQVDAALAAGMSWRQIGAKTGFSAKGMKTNVDRIAARHGINRSPA